MPAIPIIAITQSRRGHGVSTAAYFLARCLTLRGYPMLLADVTGRHAHLATLDAAFPTRRLVVWEPPPGALRNIRGALEGAQRQVASLASGILANLDLATLERLAATDPTMTPLSYLILAVEHTAEGVAVARRARRSF